MSAWMVGQIKILDRKAYRPYAERFEKVLGQYGGTLVCLADGVTVMEGEWEFPRTVLLRFADKAAAETWYRSPEYQELIALRRAAAESNIVLVENVLD